MKRSLLIFAAATAATVALAQDPAPSAEPAQPQQGGGFRRVEDAPQPPRGERAAGRDVDQRPTVLPDRISIPAGTMIALRVNDTLSSDRNQPGDTFTATLAQPIITDGFVVARRGQMVAGRVAEAIRAGRAKGTSRLALEFTEVQLADGRQVPIVTQLMQYAGGTSKGRDATAIGTTAGMGALIGAAADGGAGAGIGAGAGAAAAAIGVLLTRGRATEVYPEAMLTLRLMSPVTVDTSRAPHAFLQVHQDDYEPRLQTLQRRPSLQNNGWNTPFWGVPSVVFMGGRGWGPGWGPGWGRGWGRGWGWGGPGWGGPGWWW